MNAYRDFRSTGLIYSVHVFAELRPVSVPVSVVLSDEQEGVDHLMQERLKRGGDEDRQHDER